MTDKYGKDKFGREWLTDEEAGSLLDKLGVPYEPEGQPQNHDDFGFYFPSRYPSLNCFDKIGRRDGRPFNYQGFIQDLDYYVENPARPEVFEDLRKISDDAKSGDMKNQMNLINWHTKLVDHNGQTDTGDNIAEYYNDNFEEQLKDHSRFNRVGAWLPIHNYSGGSSASYNQISYFGSVAHRYYPEELKVIFDGLWGNSLIRKPEEMEREGRLMFLSMGMRNAADIIKGKSQNSEFYILKALAANHGLVSKEEMDSYIASSLEDKMNQCEENGDKGCSEFKYFSHPKSVSTDTSIGIPDPEVLYGLENGIIDKQFVMELFGQMRDYMKEFSAERAFSEGIEDRRLELDDLSYLRRIDPNIGEYLTRGGCVLNPQRLVPTSPAAVTDSSAIFNMKKR